MAKQNINIGSSANKGDGDPLRTAFTKINSNFTELYDAVGLGDGTLNIGSFEFNGSTITTTDSSRIEIAQEVRITSDLTMRGSIVPNIDNHFDLGSPTNQWRSLYVSSDTIFVGGVPLAVDEQGNLTVNGSPVSGGGEVSPVQPYLEVTNTPFITQPAVLGTPVTVTVPNSGQNGRIDLVITEGPTIDINDVVISAPGTGYVVGQRYKIWYYDVGGSTVDGNVEFTVDSVGANGELLAVTNVAFADGGADNGADTYLSRSFQLRAWIFDEIDVGLTLARDGNQGIYNSEAEPEYDNNTYLSPLGTEWNADGWGDLLGLGARSYTTWRSALNNQVGNNIVASELVMHDTINDKYYKFDFTAWNGNNGGYAYTRTLVEDPNYFRKEDYATANNIDVIEDDSTLQIGITRGNNNGIYNPFTEEGWDEDVSPQGTLWNIDGWDDLTDIETRTYTNLYAAFGNGGLGNKIVGTECVMYVPSIEKYYAIKFLSWTQNNQGGGFSYTRKEIDLTKLNEGIKFADGTVLKSAEGIGRVKSTAVGNRRIEEVTGFNQVSVTSVTTLNTYNPVSIARPGGAFSWDLYLDRTTNPELEAAVNLYGQFGGEGNKWRVTVNGQTYNDSNLQVYLNGAYIIIYSGNSATLPGDAGLSVTVEQITNPQPQVWWDKADLPGGSANFRGAVIDYHAYTGDSTIIGTIHIVDDDGEEHISHQEVQSGSTDGENDDLWLVTTEGQIRYRRIDGESSTLKIHWTAKVFYGSELYD